MHGISVKNNSGHLLISSDIASLHFSGQASFLSIITATGLHNFPTYAGDDGSVTLTCRTIYRFFIERADFVLPNYVPIFFIRPGNYNCSYGILNQWRENNTFWYIDILVGGPDPVVPQVFTFLPLSNSGNWPANTRLYDSTGNWPSNYTGLYDGTSGVATYSPEGTPLFDNRLNPLSIISVKSVAPPIAACDGGIPYNSGTYDYGYGDTDLDFNFKCNTTYNSYSLDTTIPYNDVMFSAPSVAQAVYSRVKMGFKRSYGTYGGGQGHASVAKWWAMYQSAYRIQPGAIHAGWATFAAGYQYSSQVDSNDWWSGGGSGENLLFGVAPYADKTINRDENLMIIASSKPYYG